MEHGAGYLYLCHEDSRLQAYHKAQKLARLNALFRQLSLDSVQFYIDQAPPSSPCRQSRKALLNDLQSITVFAATSIFELGSDLQESLSILNTLAAQQVRIILLDNNIDSAQPPLSDPHVYQMSTKKRPQTP